MVSCLSVSWLDDNLALDLPPFDHADSLRRLLKREHMVDMRADLALRAPVHEPRHLARENARIALHMAPPEHADQLAALQHHQVQCNLGDFAGREADHEIAAAPVHPPQRRLRIRAADTIEDDIRAVSAVEAAHRLLDVDAREIEKLVGAALLAELELFIRSARRD